jgi:hypothetical protein
MIFVAVLITEIFGNKDIVSLKAKKDKSSLLN